MTKSRTNPKVDAYLKTAKKWRKEIGKLREILLGHGLVEELKWGKPCYMFQASNVVVILPLKEYCALLFCKGALLQDTDGILVQAGENTQAARHLRFTNLDEIVARQVSLKGYIQQAIAVEKAGLEVVYKKTDEYAVPAELQKQFDQSAALKSAFHALTPGRQRAYLLYFSGAKQSTTREARVEKYRKQILQGKGLHD